MRYNDIIRKLKSLSNPKAVEGMARFGINPENTFGISIPDLRKLAKEIGRYHKLAQELWNSGFHEARILASMVDEPEKVTEKQMENWVKDFDSWDMCDQVCMNLFDKSPIAFKKALKFSDKKKEFERRAGFALMACLAWHDKISPDEKFYKFFDKIKKHSTDERNFVKKSVNWALRQIGKRNINLNELAIKTAREIQKMDSKSAKWIASDALKELTDEKIKKRLHE
jgi:3-methyladenine DNA glycosylase AlkD